MDGTWQTKPKLGVAMLTVTHHGYGLHVSPLPVMGTFARVELPDVFLETANCFLLVRSVRIKAEALTESGRRSSWIWDWFQDFFWALRKK